MVTLHPTRIKKIQKKLLRWYRKHGREFLWRTTSDPYTILISEIMLQQTQSSRVEEKLPAFLKRFPNFTSLANASKADVIRAWQGMGYNNRAVRLRVLAKKIVNGYHNKLPKDIAELQKLPGVGPYTAHAVACFSFRKRTTVVDVNVRRVLSRLFWRMRAPSDVRTEKEIWRLAEEILPRDAFSWNQALMELGSTACLSRKPLCNICPVENQCSSKHLMNSKSKRLNPQTSNPEPLHQGIPRRIWRGKIVEVLRYVNGQGSPTLLQLGKKVKEDFKKKDVRWLSGVIKHLERDGVVRQVKRGTRTTISLAHE